MTVRNGLPDGVDQGRLRAELVDAAARLGRSLDPTDIAFRHVHDDRLGDLVPFVAWAGERRRRWSTTGIVDTDGTSDSFTLRALGRVLGHLQATDAWDPQLVAEVTALIHSGTDRYAVVTADEADEVAAEHRVRGGVSAPRAVRHRLRPAVEFWLERRNTLVRLRVWLGQSGEAELREQRP